MIFQKLKELLSSEFEMKDLGDARKILRMKIFRDRTKKKLFLSQKTYIEKVLTRFQMLNAKPIDTPCAANFHPIMSDEMSEGEIDYMSRVSYASDVGSLMYDMVCTRPVLHMQSMLCVGSWFSRERSTGWL